MASGEAIVRKADKNLLKDNGGPIDITDLGKVTSFQAWFCEVESQ